MRRRAGSALRREAVTAFSAFVLCLNILTGTLSHTHYAAAADGLELALNGSKMAICSGTQMVFIDEDGNAIPVPQQQQHHECACCLLMLASAVMPPPSVPLALEAGAIHILRPNDAERLGTAAVQAHRNRDPPSQA